MVRITSLLIDEGAAAHERINLPLGILDLTLGILDMTRYEQSTSSWRPATAC